MSDGNGMGCFKYGCIGCASVLAIGIGLVFLVGALQVTSDREPEPAQRRAERALPPAPTPPAYSGTDGPDTVEVAPGDGFAAAPSPEATGTLVLDLAMGDFNIVPGPADQPLRVDADFDAGSFQLEEEFTSGDDGHWTYEVSFGSKGGFFGLMLGGGNNTHNEVTITVPRGHPIDIIGNIAMGESKVDLSGLWVREVHLELKAGDHFVEFREPLPFPMDRFEVKSSMGEVEIRGLGEASPERVEVQHSMGEMFLDLQGAWRRDARVEADFSMGECRVWLPEGVHLDLAEARVSMGEARTDRTVTDDLPEDAPTLTLAASGSMGSLRVER
ncbi:MAG: hypothetical protein AAGN66_14200 [Acidobacteriota bacterium]